MEEYVTKTEELNKVIEALYLVSSEADCEKICLSLDEIYLDEEGKVNPKFRHEYSSISGKIRELNEVELDGSKIYALEYLLENVSSVYEYAVKKNKPYINNLFKLKDHIGLEAGRILLVEQLEWKISNGQESVKSQLEQMNFFATAIGNQLQNSTQMLAELKAQETQIKENIDATSKTIEKIDGIANDTKVKVQGLEKEYVAILGIFASIVLSFTGGFAFTSSVLENFHNGNIYRWLIAILLVGLVLTNILYALFFYLERVMYQKNPNNIKPVIIVNVTIVALMLSVGVAWGFGVVEKVQQKNVNIFYPDNSQIEYSVSQNATNDTVSSN